LLWFRASWQAAGADAARMSAETRQLVYQTLRPLLPAHKRTFFIVLTLTLLGAGFGLIEPMVYREVIDDVSGMYVRHAYEQSGTSQHPDADTHRHHRHGQVAARTPDQALSTLLWAVVILTFTGAASRFCYLQADSRSTQAASRIEQNLVLQTFGHVLRLPLAFFSRRSAGKLTRQVDQSDAVAPILTSLAQELLPELISFVGIFAVMAFQNWQLTLIALATIPPYVWVARLSSRRLEQTATTYYEQWDAVSSRLAERLAGVKTVKLSGAEQREVDVLEHEMSEAYGTHIDRVRAENRYSNWQGMLVQIGEAVVLGFGGYYVLQNKLTPGDVVMFVTYLNQAYDPIDNLSTLITTLQEHIASVARAARVLQAKPEPNAGAGLLAGPGQIAFEDVHFGYTPTRDVLRGVSFTLQAGKTTALVGPSGAGKTTSSDLLLRLFEPKSGRITIDGQDIRELEISALRSAVAVVAVDGTLFNGTLADNIRYRRPDATDAEAHEAAVSAGLSRALERLPDGLQSTVGDQGVGLSAGERQRMQIARALLSRPRVLVLDEATANLDYATQLEVKAAIDRARAGSTTLVIAHRYSMVKDADHVVVLEAGKVVDQGSPAELLQRDGFFSRFAKHDANVVEPPQRDSAAAVITSDAQAEELVEEEGEEVADENEEAEGDAGDEGGEASEEGDAESDEMNEDAAEDEESDEDTDR
jgi:ABC-type multidrug transport system fused ATPase/permease subunit